MSSPEVTLPPEFQPISVTEPLPTFQAWLQEAKQCERIYQPPHMNLATVSKDGRPHNRAVTLAGPVTEEGLLFMTWGMSNKVKQLEENPYVSVCFHWDPLFKHVRIEGKACPLSLERRWIPSSNI